MAALFLTRSSVAMSAKIKWEEPAEFTRDFVRANGEAPSRLTVILAALLVTGAVVLLIWGYEQFFLWLHKKDLGVPLYVYLVFPPLAGLFVGFLPKMAAVIPATIILTEKGIHRNKAIGSTMSLQLWPWETITKLTMEEVQFGDNVHRALVVKSELEAVDVLIGLGNAPLPEVIEFIDRMDTPLIKRI